MSHCPEKLLLENLVETIVAQAEEARATWLNSKGTPDEAFNAGVVQGYWQVLDSLKSRLAIYGVQLETARLETMEPDEIWQA